MPKSVEFMSKTTSVETNTQNPQEHCDPLSSLLRQLRFGAKVIFRSEYCGQWGVDTSGSQHIAFHLISEGEGWLHGFDDQPQRLIAGQLVMFPHDATHLLSGSEERPPAKDINKAAPEHIVSPATRLICGYFTFDQAALKPLLIGLPDAVVLNLSESDNPSARELINLWMREAADQQAGSDVAVDRLAELVFIELLRNELRHKRLDGAFGALGDARLSQVMADIHANPGAPHTVTAMASKAGMSESAFAQRFKNLVGMSSGQYVKHWRMQSAARALSETTRSITDIAEASGYDSEAAFRKAFRAHFDIAPGRHRRENRAT